MPKSATKNTNQLAAIAAWMTGQNVVLGGVAWSIFTLLYFMLFSVTAPGEESPFWYLLGTYILETVPFILATWLCYRNWQSPQIASGREVWFFIGLGMLVYTIANFIYGIWELYFLLDPAVSPADFLYFAFTGLVAWGMILAVLPRRLNLEPKQWLIIGGVAVFGILLALLITYLADKVEEVDAQIMPLQAIPAAYAQAPPATPPPAAPTDPNVVPPVDPNAAPPVDPNAPVPAAPPVAVEEEEVSNAPGWVLALESMLEPFEEPVNLFYKLADVMLLIIASTLLLAFWGGRFSQSWRMIAAGTLCQYIGDLATSVAISLPGQFESGGLFEVFYVFSGALYAMGAALEFDVSTSRSGRGRRRRGGA